TTSARRCSTTRSARGPGVESAGGAQRAGSDLGSWVLAEDLGERTVDLGCVVDRGGAAGGVAGRVVEVLGTGQQVRVVPDGVVCGAKTPPLSACCRAAASVGSMLETASSSWSTSIVMPRA